jgi:hypothetical protein
MLQTTRLEGQSKNLVSDTPTKNEYSRDQFNYFCCSLGIFGFPDFLKIRSMLLRCRFIERPVEDEDTQAPFMPQQGSTRIDLIPTVAALANGATPSAQSGLKPSDSMISSARAGRRRRRGNAEKIYFH